MVLPPIFTTGLEEVCIPSLVVHYIQEAENYFTVEAAEYFTSHPTVDYVCKVWPPRHQWLRSPPPWVM